MESGFERSIRGIPEKTVVGFLFLINENCSRAGLDISTIVVVVVVVVWKQGRERARERERSRLS